MWPVQYRKCGVFPCLQPACAAFIVTCRPQPRCAAARPEGNRQEFLHMHQTQACPDKTAVASPLTGLQVGKCNRSLMRSLRSRVVSELRNVPNRL
jgi:hypothetical protein